MKAAVIPKYGPPSILEIREVEKPKGREGEVLVKIGAASVNAADWHIIRGTPRLIRLGFGLFRPKIKAAGVDAAGTVEAVGDGVTDFAPGDVVFGELAGYGCGAFAEYVSAPTSAFEKIPKHATIEEAACLPVAGQTAL
ncbi:MAG: alcohol dehydrogenase catalytic domain-containing protein [Alkalispirochaeta sp.]